MEGSDGGAFKGLAASQAPSKHLIGVLAWALTLAPPISFGGAGEGVTKWSCMPKPIFCLIWFFLELTLLLEIKCMLSQKITNKEDLCSSHLIFAQHFFLQTSLGVYTGKGALQICPLGRCLLVLPLDVIDTKLTGGLVYKRPTGLVYLCSVQ